jgi:hypothetical protein
VRMTRWRRWDPIDTRHFGFEDQIVMIYTKYERYRMLFVVSRLLVSHCRCRRRISNLFMIYTRQRMSSSSEGRKDGRNGFKEKEEKCRYTGLSGSQVIVIVVVVVVSDSPTHSYQLNPHHTQSYTASLHSSLLRIDTPFGL